jgi:dynein heavy chain 1
VWNALTNLDGELDEMREKPWMSLQPRKVRQAIDTLLTQLKELPAKYRTYDAYECFKRRIQSYSKVAIVIALMFK